MLPLVYYNYSQVGGNDLQNLIIFCNKNFGFKDINDPILIDEIDIYKKIKSLKNNEEKDLQFKVMMANKENKRIWQFWNIEVNGKSLYELFQEAKAPKVGKLKLPTGFKLPGAPEPSGPDYSQYKKLLKVGVSLDIVAKKMINDLRITREEADKIISEFDKKSSASVSTTASPLPGASISTTAPPPPPLPGTSGPPSGLMASIRKGTTLKSKESSPTAPSPGPSGPPSGLMASIRKGMTLKSKESSPTAPSSKNEKSSKKPDTKQPKLDLSSIVGVKLKPSKHVEKEKPEKELTELEKKLKKQREGINGGHYTISYSV